MKFTKMQGLGNDYVYVNCLKETIADPPALAKKISDRHFGVGSDGLIMINPSYKADFEMDMYNADGSRAEMCGNGIRCVAKYLFDNGIVKNKHMTIETLSGVREMTLFTFNGKVSSVSVNMGKAVLEGKKIPSTLEGDKIVNREIAVGDKNYNVTLVNVGNPHCVVFCDKVDAVDVANVGPLFEYAKYFPQRVNVEFVRVVNDKTLKCAYGNVVTVKLWRAVRVRRLGSWRLCWADIARRTKISRSRYAAAI